VSLLDKLLTGTTSTGAAPTGNGFPHVTAGNYDPVARNIGGLDITLSGQSVGALAYHDGTEWLGLAPGDVGDVLTSTGTSSAPTWAEPGAGTAPPDASLVVPPSVAALGVQGSSLAFARADHTHAGLTSFNALTGAVTLEVGPELTLSAVGNALTLTFGIAGQTAGDLFYFDGTDWARVAGGAAGSVLQSNGETAAPYWGTIEQATGPDAATVAPPAIAATGAVGSSAAYALEDHTHAGITSIVAAGSVTASTVGGVVTVTGTAATAANAAPPAIADAAALGSSSDYAREDHTHAGVHKFNGLMGDVVLSPGNNITIQPSYTGSQTLVISAASGSGSSGTGATAAASAPPAVASASALGSSAAYAREDHTHSGVTSIAVAGTGLSISSSSGAVTITGSGGGGSSVTPADAAPPAIAAAGAVGVSTEYAREDHTHAGLVSVAASTGISVSTVSGVATITNTVTAPTAASTTPTAIASAGAVGVATTYARGDHTHGGVTSVNTMQGAMTIVASGTGITVTNDTTAKTVTLSSTAATVPAAGPVISTGSALTSRLLMGTDLNSSAAIAITQLAAAGQNGQSIVQANDAMTFAPPGTISRIVSYPASSGNTDVLLYTSPGSGSGVKVVITGVYCVLSEAITGTGSITISAGITAGGIEYLKAITLTSATAHHARRYGLSMSTEMGTAFVAAADYNYNVDFAQGASINARAAASGSISYGGKIIWFVTGEVSS
jgi:hypothetical protein